MIGFITALNIYILYNFLNIILHLKFVPNIVIVPNIRYCIALIFNFIRILIYNIKNQFIFDEVIRLRNLFITKTRRVIKTSIQ